MAKYRLYLLGIFLLTLTTCIFFPVPLSYDFTATIPKRGPLGDLLNDVAFSNFDFTIQGKQQLESQNVNESDINSVRLKSLTLEVISPTGQDLSFFKNLEFFVKAEGQPDLRVAHQNSFVEGQSTVMFELDDVELKPYIIADSMKISANGTGSLPDNETTIKLTADLNADINVAAICNKR